MGCALSRDRPTGHGMRTAYRPKCNFLPSRRRNGGRRLWFRAKREAWRLGGAALRLSTCRPDTLGLMRTNLSVEELGTFLDEPRVAVLATLRVDGTVLLSPVYHEWREGAFNVVIETQPGSTQRWWSRRGRRAPRISDTRRRVGCCVRRMVGGRGVADEMICARTGVPAPGRACRTDGWQIRRQPGPRRDLGASCCPP